MKRRHFFSSILGLGALGPVETQAQTPSSTQLLGLPLAEIPTVWFPSGLLYTVGSAAGHEIAVYRNGLRQSQGEDYSYDWQFVVFKTPNAPDDILRIDVRP